jgi:hypothetical protein
MRIIAILKGDASAYAGYQVLGRDYGGIRDAWEYHGIPPYAGANALEALEDFHTELTAADPGKPGESVEYTTNTARCSCWHE